MARPGPSAASKKISEYVKVQDPPRSLVAVLIEIVTENNWVNDENIPAEQAEIWSKGFKATLKAQMRSAHEAGQFIPYTLSEVSDDYVQGSCFVSPRDDTEVAEAKTHRAHAVKIAKLFHQLTPDNFEQLCTQSLRLLGVQNPFTSQHSADQGIDFYGLVKFGELFSDGYLPTMAESQFDLWLVGQAKHYTASQVGTADIRELVGSVELARTKIFAGSSDPLANLKIRACDPVFFLFFTTGTISRDARKLLKMSGVVGMDGIQFATLLADRKIAVEAGVFSASKFWGWLNGSTNPHP